MTTVLVVDDERQIAQIARDYLEHAGFAVITATDGRDALARARASHPDLVVLDLGLPTIDGLDVAKTLRRESDVPIIMLTARVDESDRLIGLAVGADDYITKPFSPRELVARVRAVLRRTNTAGDEVLRVADLMIDAPPWWPANEPWPPRHRRHAWHRGRARFVRRVALMFGLLLVLSSIGAVTLFSVLFHRGGVIGQPSQLSSWAIVAAFAFVILAAGLFGLMRRVGLPISDVVAAADRVASGDYAVRLAEHGPPSLRSVARAFNSMTTQLQRQDEQRRHLMADIAHEL